MSCQWLVTGLLAGLLWPSAAAATPETMDAQTAFDEGMALMNRGEFDRACPMLEHSVELEPAMAATFRLAECMQEIGRLASAWRRYTEVAKAARAAGMTDRAKTARGRAAALVPRLAKLRIQVPDEVADLPGVKVLCDGEVLAEAQWSEAVPMDEGNHSVTVTAAGKEQWVTVAVVTGEGGTTQVEVPALVDERSGSTGDDGGVAGQTIAGIVVASAGLVTMGIGGVMAAIADGTYGESELHCVDNRCEPEGLDLRETAIGQADIATVLFAVGAGVTAGGLVLWLTAPDGEESSRSGWARPFEVGVAPTGLHLRGSW